MEKLIITAAICGAEVTKKQNPNVPYTVEEMVREAKSAYNAGAAIIHVHVREDDGTPTQDRERFRVVMDAIRAELPDVIMIPSTGGATGMKPEERLQPTELFPEMATLDCGTCNFGDEIFDNTMPTMRAFGKRMIENGIKPEYECFEMGHLDTTIPALKKQLADTERGIENMLNAIQQGVLTGSTKERLEALEKQRDNLKIAVLQAELQKPKYTKEQIVSWIGQFKYGDVNSREYQKRIIDTFVNSLYLFDDRLVITYNFKGGTETITLKDVEAAYGSDLKAVSPPQTLRTDMVQRVFCYVTAHPSLLFLDKIRLCSYYNYC